MDNGQKYRKRGRMKLLFKRKEREQQVPSSQVTSIPSDVSPAYANADSGDRQRTRTKYLEATKLLEETVKAYEGRWGSFHYPELRGEPEDFDDSLFREKLNIVMDALKNEVNNQTAWEKCRHIVQCAFTAFSPFAKTFLTIIKEGQAVFFIPYRL